MHTEAIQITQKQLVGAFEHIMTSHLVVNSFIHATITTAIDEDRVHHSKRSNAPDSDSEAER